MALTAWLAITSGRREAAVAAVVGVAVVVVEDVTLEDVSSTCEVGGVGDSLGSWIWSLVRYWALISSLLLCSPSLISSKSTLSRLSLRPVCGGLGSEGRRMPGLLGRPGSSGGSCLSACQVDLG